MDTVGCIVMASGLSVRYGKNKLMEKIAGREMILHTTDHLRQAGLEPLAVTRSSEVKKLLDQSGIRCILHAKPLKSDAMHIALEQLGPDPAGYLFMPADQPLVMPETLQRLVDAFLEDPEWPLRLGFGETPGSPVVFPASLREELLAYRGNRGGSEILRRHGLPCRICQAAYEWELWDVDTPERMEQVRRLRKTRTEILDRKPEQRA